MSVPLAPSPTPPMTREQAEALASRLVEEMTQRWRKGDPVTVEAYLAHYPSLNEHPEAAADLIYEELCLRQEYNQEQPIEAVLARFPAWRAQLEVLLDCQRVLGPRSTTISFPEVGEYFGDFFLLQVLGQGVLGRVYLASQVSLGDRPVVLKLAPRDDHEYLSLARLQHTHIVPLHSIHDLPNQALRGLCMPFFGGLSLSQLLLALRSIPVAQRTGRHIAELLERAQPRLAESTQTPERQALASVSYTEAIGWIGMCLAEALQYAHQRGLVHLDLKPSNILLAADGQPMLLDFHLARSPITAADQTIARLGGTWDYTSPEQREAMRAIQQGQSIPRAVEGRSDQYSLGLVLFEALAGKPAPGHIPKLNSQNPQVSLGLSDILARCLAEDPSRRYPDLASLASDLRRHLEHQPLQGVRNRSWRERWSKWRAARPQGLVMATMLFAVLSATLALFLGMAQHYQHRLSESHHDLQEGTASLASHHPEIALAVLKRGLTTAQSLPFQSELREQFQSILSQAESEQIQVQRAAAFRELHQIAERARFIYGLSLDAIPDRARLEKSCRTLWQQRSLLAKSMSELDPESLRQAREDIGELAILWFHLQENAENSDSVRILSEAESLLGPQPVLRLEIEKIPLTQVDDRDTKSVWQHIVLGRALVQRGSYEDAERELSEAIRMQPNGLWPHFYAGQCAMRQGRFEDAVLAYSICIGAAPEPAGCFYHRSIAYAALGQASPSRQDYETALRLDPSLQVFPVPNVAKR